MVFLKPSEGRYANLLDDLEERLSNNIVEVALIELSFWASDVFLDFVALKSEGVIFLFAPCEIHVLEDHAAIGFKRGGR